ncbi:transglutaminase-like domain-containing protein [Enhygromyxa salina]|uniref:Transglutaminase-like superfamily protein n=1 Tax=Enhygromyxa salina TaxID=215803 RepID=A0A2S9YM55_9BACT|nr:transglutaminase-like domain-containing protein [Enhygromyxa salina]PRQ06175.1 Transglutaminase-like superfamily protein [Enhygromyxa salina]
MCTSQCIEVTLPIDVRGGAELPLPVPSGHRLDVSSLVFEPTHSVDALGTSVLAGPKRVFASAAGEPVLILGWSLEGTLRYRTGPGSIVSMPPRSDAALPEQLLLEARALRELPAKQRPRAAIDLVQARVRYETSNAVAVQHQVAVLEGKDFVTRTLEIGAGDCDVQNGLLVAVLHAADIDARLAVGWVGHEGSVSAWLHAWVEYLGEDGSWRVADATARATTAGGSIPGLPPPPAGVAVASLDLDAGPDGGSLEPTARVEPPSSNEAGDPSDPNDPSDPSSQGNGSTPAVAGDNPGVITVIDQTGSQPSSASIRDRLPPGLVAALTGPWVPWLALSCGLLGLGLLGVSLSRRTARRFSLDEGVDLSGLLQGALAQPAAYRHLPSLFHRRLIPLRGGAALSLNRVRALASEGRLYAGGEQTELCRDARRRGVSLLDAQTPVGRTVAASLGAIDLDRWGHRLARATEVLVLGIVAAYLRDQGERWRCAAVRGLGERVATLDLRPLGSSRRIGDRLVLLDVDDAWLLEAERLRPTRPHAAAFALLDHLLDHLDLGTERRARLLAPLAALALVETANLDDPPPGNPDTAEPSHG